MFSDKSFQVEGFDSTWKSVKPSVDQMSQTTEFASVDQGTSTNAHFNIEVQTDKEEEDPTEEAATNNSEDEMERLAVWLKNICPNVIAEMNDDSYSRAKAEIDSMGVKSAQIENEIILLQEFPVLEKDFGIHTKTKPSSEIEEIKESDKKKTLIGYVSCCSWNNTGNFLAVSISYQHKKSWCHHPGLIFIYSLNRDGVLAVEPIKKLQLNCCVTTLSYHPEKPNVLSAGTMYGEMYLFDTTDVEDVPNKEESNLKYLVAMVSEHDDRITDLVWLINHQTRQYQLVTVSLDSYLFFWEVNADMNIFKVTSRYTIGKVNKSITSPEAFTTKSLGGISAVDFSPIFTGSTAGNINYTFVLGTEAGSIIKCSTYGAKVQIHGDDKIFDPTISEYEAHDGKILSLKFSPHRKDLFISCAYFDEQIKIFHVDQVTPVQIIFVDLPLNYLNWVLHEEKLLIGCGPNGTIYIFSCLNGQKIGFHVTDQTEDKFNNKNPLTIFTMNSKSVNTIAFGTDDGMIQLYSIPWEKFAERDYNQLYGDK